MNNLTLSVQSLGNGGLVSEKTSFVLSEKLPSNVRTGMLLKFSEMPDLNLVHNKNLLELNLILPNGEKVQVTAKINIPVNMVDITNSNLAVRVTKDGNLQLVNIKKENVNNANDVFSYKPSIPDIVTYPTKLMPLLDKIMIEENFPIDVKKWVGEVMADAELVSRLKGFEKSDGGESILEQIRQILRNLKNSLPEQHKILKQQFIKDIENLVGKSFEAKFYYDDGNVKISSLESPLGKIYAETMPKLSKDEVVQMEILKIRLGNKPDLWRIINDFGKHLLRVLPEDNQQADSLIGLLKNSDNETTFLAKMLLPLLEQVDANKYITSLLQKVVSIKPNILSNIYAFYRLIQSESVKEWLGDDLYAELKSSIGGNEVIQNVEQLLQSSLKDMPMWKIVEFPFFDGSQLLNWRISLKKNNDERESEQNKCRDDEVRFVIDTEFSKLGAFQFDGFALKKQKRFDLIIRTSLSQSDDFCANIMALFRKSLSELDYSGTIKINQKEEFLKPYVIENKIVDGVYI